MRRRISFRARVRGLPAGARRADRSRAELAARLRQQEAVARLGQLALLQVSDDDLLREAAALVAETLPVDRVSILELDPEGTSLMLRAGAGWPEEWLGTYPVAGARASHAGFALMTGRPVVVSDLRKETEFASLPLLAAGVVSGLNTRIGGEDPWGVIGAYTLERRRFGEHDVHFLQAVANVLASALRRHAAEDALREAHALLSTVIEGTNDSVYVKDRERRYLLINAAGARALGREVDEVVGHADDEVMPSAFAAAVADDDDAVLADGEVRTFEETIVLPNGESRSFLTTKGPYRDAAGATIGTFGLSHDITARKAQELELMRSEARFRLAQETARLGTWDIDLVTGTSVWSDGLRTLLGVDATTEPTPELFLSRSHPEDRARVERTIADALEHAREYEVESRVVWPDGSTHWLLSRGIVLRGADGLPARKIGVAIDTTERHRAAEEREELEARLRQAEKMEAIGRLAGGVAHDFNNLLLAIRGSAELALARIARGEPAASSAVEDILVAGDRAAALTRQLLAFGRRQMLNPEIVDLAEIVAETEHLLSRLIGEHIDIRVSSPGEPVRIEADRSQIEQVLTNLAVNARDAMAGGGRLEIDVSVEQLDGAGPDGLPPGPYAVLRVADTGSGMDAVTRAAAFEPFFTTKGDDGNGLGLATVHGIVTQSSGAIALDTEPGRGSVFRIHLPLAASDAAPAAAAPPAAAGSGRGEVVLLVEDEPIVRNVVGTMLEENGYIAHAAGSGAEALAVLEGGAVPDILLTDLVLRGGETGRDVADRVSEARPGIHVLYMSGYSDDAVVRDPGRSREIAFIQKPFTAAELGERVRAMIDGRAA